MKALFFDKQFFKKKRKDILIFEQNVMNELFLKELIFLIHVGKNRALVHPPNFVFIGPIIPYKQLLFNHYNLPSKIVEKKLYS